MRLPSWLGGGQGEQEQGEPTEEVQMIYHMTDESTGRPFTFNGPVLPTQHDAHDGGCSCVECWDAHIHMRESPLPFDPGPEYIEGTIEKFFRLR